MAYGSSGWQAIRGSTLSRLSGLKTNGFCLQIQKLVHRLDLKAAPLDPSFFFFFLMLFAFLYVLYAAPLPRLFFFPLHFPPSSNSRYHNFYLFFSSLPSKRLFLKK